MRIRTGSRITTVAIACGIAVLVAINAYGVHLVDEERRFDALSRDITNAVFDLNVLANELGLRKSERVSAQFRARLNRLNQSLDLIEESPRSQPSIVNRMKRSAASLEAFFVRLDNLQTGAGGAVRSRNALVQSFLSASQTLADLARRQSSVSEQSIQAIEFDIKVMSGATLLVTILLLTGTYIYIVVAILNPIVRLHEKIVGLAPSTSPDGMAVPNRNEIKVISNELDQRLETIYAKEQDLAAQASELKRSNSDLEEFAYIASHDLKEPIRAISNHAQFLAEDHGELLGEDGKKRIIRIRDLCRRSESLVSDLLEFSRIGRADEEPRVIDVMALIEKVRESLRDYLAERNATVEIVGALPKVTGVPPRIESIFRNLIINGVKYNDQGSKLIEIGFRPGEGDATGEFYVRDNGIGIPEQHQSKIFTIFKRLHNDRVYGAGTGAGLSIVRKIVEQHGGQIAVESQQGEGSTFVFGLNGAGS